MPDLCSTPARPAKRRRLEAEGLPSTTKDKTPADLAIGKGPDRIAQKVLQSQKNYNGIAELLLLARDADQPFLGIKKVWALLSHVFVELHLGQEGHSGSSVSESSAIVKQWMQARLDAFRSLLIHSIRTGDTRTSIAALENVVQLLRIEAGLPQTSKRTESMTTSCQDVVHAILEAKTHDTLLVYLKEHLIQPYNDLHLLFLYGLKQALLKMNATLGGNQHETENDIAARFQQILNLLYCLSPHAVRVTEPRLFLVQGQPTDTGSKLAQNLVKAAADCWRTVLLQSMAPLQRRQLLSAVADQLLEWFPHVELLLDFLSDSFRLGGSPALTALAGLFWLIEHKNLDYPQFYTQLYSLLDTSVLHARQRSQFLNLLERSLASTHLPATLISSFVKRLARLCLHASPAAIVAIVPWVYNLLKQHPACTLMIQRAHSMPTRDATTPWHDTFRMEETDPLQTGAIASSLWEFKTLQTHYNSGVAAIARILSEQFTKQSYALEDFRDHSYRSMISAELSRPLRHPPVVEFQIPRYVFPSLDVERTGLWSQTWEIAPSKTAK